jgi:NAD+ diphosphatase
MTRLSNPPPHRYSGAGFDRSAHRRLDPAWLSARRAEGGTRVILMSGLEVLVSASDEPSALLLTVAELGGPLPETAIFLGEHEGAGLFAADLGGVTPPGGRFVEVRAVGARLQAQEAGWLAYARALAHWHSRHRFCGVCGGPTVSEQGGHVRRCEICGAQHFPRSDPAVIVLVTHSHPELAERCLLGRSARFPAGMYSTLAGFVEPGESLEETVRREIYEEAGVELTDIQYRSSQPWPFPASLMLGFRATARSDELRIDSQELVAAGWYTRAQLIDPERRPVQLPNLDSIARHLIEDWLFEEAGGG